MALIIALSGMWENEYGEVAAVYGKGCVHCPQSDVAVDRGAFARQHNQTGFYVTQLQQLNTNKLFHAHI